MTEAGNVSGEKKQRRATRRVAAAGSDSDETEPSSDEEGSDAKEEGEGGGAKRRRGVAALEELELEEFGGEAPRRKAVRRWQGRRDDGSVEKEGEGRLRGMTSLREVESDGKISW